MEQSSFIDEFNFETDVPSTSWIVKPIVPAGQLCVFLAQSGVGKSLLVENLAVHLVYGLSFGGFDTCEGDVLLIDQDTPTETLTQRLVRFGKAMGQEKKYQLFWRSMKGYSLSDGTIIQAINEFPSARLVVIDSLHSVCGRFNPNYTSDMNTLAKLKSKCLTGDKTIALVHHITDKVNYSLGELMTGNPHALSMGASVIIQQADTYYIISASAENGVTNKIYLRPVAKRVAVTSQPYVFQFVHPTPDSERLESGEEYSPGLSDAENDTLAFFKAKPSSDHTVEEVYKSMGHFHGEVATRKALSDLTRKGLLVLSRQRHNCFKYRLP